MVNLYYSFCFRCKSSRLFKAFICFLLFFILFSAFVLPIKQAQAVTFAPLVYKGASMIFDLSVGGLIAGGVIAADTQIKKSDQYKFISAYLGYCSAKQLERLEELASSPAGSSISTSAVSDLISLMLGSFSTSTITTNNLGSVPSWFPGQTDDVVITDCGAGTFYYLITNQTFSGGSSRYNLYLSQGPFVWSDNIKDGSYDYSGYIISAYAVLGHYFGAFSDTLDFSSDVWGRVTTSATTPYIRINQWQTMISMGTIALGAVMTPDVDLSKSISLTDTWAIPAEVNVCDDSWANDEAYKVAYPPWLADMDLAGDIVITPSLENTSDIPGELTPDGSSITQTITGLWNWLKGILASILEAIKAIPALITSIFDVSQFQLDFTPFKSLVIKEKFPFCIPFDFRNAIKTFSATASDYRMEIDLETSFFAIHHTVDLSPFAVPIAFFRYAACVWFSIILITKTKDLMKW